MKRTAGKVGQMRAINRRLAASAMLSSEVRYYRLFWEIRLTAGEELLVQMNGCGIGKGAKTMHITSYTIQNLQDGENTGS